MQLLHSKNYFKLAMLFTVVAALSACGNNSIIEKVTVNTSQDNNQNVWVSMDTQLNMGGLSFPSLTIPIANPRFPKEILGKVTLQRTLEGKNNLLVDANLTEISNNQFANDNLLPNGNALPISGLNGVVSVRFNTSSKLYLGGSDTSMMFGVALAIPLFDSINKYIPGASTLFLNLPTGSQVDGLGGVFIGNTGSSGIGLFIKVPNSIIISSSQSLIANLNTNSSANMQSLKTAKSMALNNQTSSFISNGKNLKFNSSDESSSKSIKMKQLLLNLSLQNKVLNIK